MWKMIILEKGTPVATLKEVETIFSTGNFGSLEELLFNALEEVNPIENEAIVYIIAKNLETGKAYSVYSHASTGRPPFAGVYRVGEVRLDLSGAYLNDKFHVIKFNELGKPVLSAVYGEVTENPLRPIVFTGYEVGFYDQCKILLKLAKDMLSEASLPTAAPVMYINLAGDKAHTF